MDWTISKASISDMYDTIWNSREEICNTGGKKTHNYTVFDYTHKYDAISSTPAASVSYTHNKSSPMTYLRFQRRLQENSPKVGRQVRIPVNSFVQVQDTELRVCQESTERRKRRWWREGAKSLTCGRPSRSREDTCVQSSKRAGMTTEGRVVKCVDAVRKERQ